MTAQVQTNQPQVTSHQAQPQQVAAQTQAAAPSTHQVAVSTAEQQQTTGQKIAQALSPDQAVTNSVWKSLSKELSKESQAHNLEQLTAIVNHPKDHKNVHYLQSTFTQNLAAIAKNKEEKAEVKRLVINHLGSIAASNDYSDSLVSKATNNLVLLATGKDPHNPFKKDKFEGSVMDQKPSNTNNNDLEDLAMTALTKASSENPNILHAILQESTSWKDTKTPQFALEMTKRLIESNPNKAYSEIDIFLNTGFTPYERSEEFSKTLGQLSEIVSASNGDASLKNDLLLQIQKRQKYLPA